MTTPTRRFLARQAAALAAIDPRLRPGRRVRRSTLLRGGKRLRPAFSYWGWRGAGTTRRPMTTAAAALELFQAAALVHDDVMDGSDTRRGRPRPTCASPSCMRRSAGTATRVFGRRGAILVGDLCLAWSDELFAACGLPPPRWPRRAVFDTMRTEVIAGQYLDLLGRRCRDAARRLGVEGALKVIRYKSAGYTIQHPPPLGGTLAGPRRRAGGLRRLRAAARRGVPAARRRPWGVRDPAVTGKPAGDDLREGKQTLNRAGAGRRPTPAQAGRSTASRQPPLGPAGVDSAPPAIIRHRARPRRGADRGADRRGAAALAAARSPSPRARCSPAGGRGDHPQKKKKKKKKRPP